jgi:hypothetical protein
VDWPEALAVLDDARTYAHGALHAQERARQRSRQIDAERYAAGMPPETAPQATIAARGAATAELASALAATEYCAVAAKLMRRHQRNQAAPKHLTFAALPFADDPMPPDLQRAYAKAGKSRYGLRHTRPTGLRRWKQPHAPFGVDAVWDIIPVPAPPSDADAERHAIAVGFVVPPAYPEPLADAVRAAAAALRECADLRRNPPSRLAEPLPYGGSYVPEHLGEQYQAEKDAFDAVHDRARIYADAVHALRHAVLTCSSSLAPAQCQSAAIACRG